MGKAKRRNRRAINDANTAFKGAMSAYDNFNITNSYGSLQNTAGGMTNFAENLTNFGVGVQDRADSMQNFSSQMQNTAEDLTVNTQQAEFQAQQQQQGLANTMGSLRSAAGGSGIAGLAQAMAGQQSQNLQQASASIGMQESQNAQMAAQQGARIQQMTAQESSANQSAGLQAAQFGASMSQANQMASVNALSRNQDMFVQQGSANQMARASGDQYMQQAGMDKVSTKLGMASERVAAANAAEQARKDRNAALIGDVVGAVGSAVGAFSDRRLKKNIKFVGKSKKGFKIYTFEYKNKEYGEGTYQGVMSDEIPSEFVIKKNNGFDFVDYSNLDVQFKKI
tara:strand:- start:7534 stop:8550 length:1017 start_codon:yes stop_codon:yes gene_type:complete